MTKEQQDWMEYALAKDAWERIKRIWCIPGESKAEQKCRIIYAIKNNPYCETAICWRNYTAAHKRAMAWKPLCLRSCENCAMFRCEDDEMRVWHCTAQVSSDNAHYPDEVSCAAWAPNTQKGGEQ